MSKAFTKDSGADADDPDDDAAALPALVKNYVTPAGHAALRDELRRLLTISTTLGRSSCSNRRSSSRSAA